MCSHCILIGLVSSIPFWPICYKEGRAFYAAIGRGIHWVGAQLARPLEAAMNWVLSCRPMSSVETACMAALVPILFGAAVFFNFSP